VKRLVVTFALLTLASPGRANPLDYFGVGPRAMGLGGSLTALADDFSATHYNPAGLATRDALQLELGYLRVDPTLTLNDQDLGVDGVHAFQGGLVVPGKLGGHRLAVALGLHLPDERITRLRALPAAQPRFALYDNHPQRLVLTTSVAFEIIPDKVSLGAGLTYLSDTRGSLDVTGLVDFENAGNTTLVSSVDVDFVAARSPSFGLLFRPTPDLRVGLTYREEFDLTLDIGVAVNGDIVLDGASENPIPLVEGATLTLGSRNSNLFSPRSLVLGVAWTRPAADGLPPCTTITAEIGWHQWSRMKSPTANLTTSLEAGSLPIALPPTPLPLDPDFHDILIARAGYEQRLIELPHFVLHGRVGAFFEPSPAPIQRGESNFVDNDKIGLGLGFSLAFRDLTEVLPRPFFLDFGFQYIGLLERVHDKLDPSDPSGDYTSDGHFVGFSSNLKFEF
jgi:long-chain fatty acid transport protein